MESNFSQFGIDQTLLRAVQEASFETATPIQEQTIPPLLEGRDVLGQAQTGTGKTAAFGLPMLQRVNPAQRFVQGLVLAPTRELALQVTDALQSFGKYRGVQVTTIYGGQPIEPQARRLAQGVQIVVGTPGRVADHLRRGSLRLDHVTFVTLDEADEMLNMGFIEDVTWILEQAPATKQMALFSATLPDEVRALARRFLHDPVTVRIEPQKATVSEVEQRRYDVTRAGKMEALVRILEVEQPQSALIFARMRANAAELAESLVALGFKAEALHGDMSQVARETVMRRVRNGRVRLLVATDVAARGLDVENISHVINYDLPDDGENYVHRIGRTARAGRQGVAIMLVVPAERNNVRNIERYINQHIPLYRVPTPADVAARRRERFKESVRTAIAEANLDSYTSLVSELAAEHPVETVAAALAHLLKEADGRAPATSSAATRAEPVAERVTSFERPVFHSPTDRVATRARANRFASTLPESNQDMVRLFLDLGRKAGVRPEDIVGAIANEANIPGRAIGPISIYDRFAFVEVPKQYTQQVLARMSSTTLRGKPVKFTVAVPQRA